MEHAMVQGRGAEAREGSLLHTSSRAFISRPGAELKPLGPQAQAGKACLQLIPRQAGARIVPRRPTEPTVIVGAPHTSADKLSSSQRSSVFHAPSWALFNATPSWAPWHP